VRTPLNQSDTLYLSQGIKPRLFVRVSDSLDNTILCQSTKATGEYEDRIETLGTINQSIRPEGGMAEVSGATFNRIILDERLTLCTEADIAPYVSGVVMGAGRLMTQGLPGVSYSTVRNSITATNYQTPALVIGRYKNVGGNYCTVWRAPLEFAILAGVTSCEDAYIAVTGMSDSSSTDFTLIGVAGTWTAPITAADFNNFSVWQASGDYTSFITNLIESWTTAEYGTTVYLRLNTAGRAAIVGATGGYFKLMLMSNLDTTNAAAPSGNEYVQFEASTARLKLRYNSQTLDNQNVEILFGMETLPATITNATIDAVWKGVLDSYEIGNKAFSGTAKQNDHKKNCMIPANVTTKEDFPDCPEDNMGKGYPVVYGEFYDTLYGLQKDGIGRDNPAVPGPVGALGLRGYIPGLVVKSYGGSYANPGQLLIAGSVINNVSDSVPALWNGSRKTFERYWVSIGVSQTGANGCTYIEFTPALRTVHSTDGTVLGNEEFIGRAFSVIPSRIVRQDAVNPEYAYSGTTVQYALLDGANAYFECGFEQQGSFSERDRVEVVFDMVQTGAGTLSVSLRELDVELLSASGTDGSSFTYLGGYYFQSSSASFLGAGISEDDLLIVTGGVNAGEWPIDSVNDDNSLLMKWELAEETGQTYKILSRGAEIETTGGVIGTTGQKCVPLTLFTDDPSKYILRIDQTVGAGNFRISNLQVRIFMPEDEKPTEIFLDSKGMEYGSWIDAVDRTNSYDSGDLIENPAHVIESIGRDEMGLLTAEIDTTAFDAAATAIDGDVFAFQLLDRKPARELLDELAYQARLFLWWDEQDRLTVKAYDAAAFFPNSGTDIPGVLDIFTITGEPSAGTFTNHPILHAGNDFLSRMPMDDCKNDFVLKYKQNYATGDYAEVLTCNTDGNNLTEGYLSDYTPAALQALCTASETALLTRNTLTVEAWAIRDESTANRLMERLVVWLSKRRYILRFTAGISALRFELGDYINVREDRIYDLFGTAVTERKKWMCIKLNPNPAKATIEIEAIEV